jgi:hypothetical protein
MKMRPRAVGRVGLFCVVLFGVIGGCNSLIYAQDVAVDTNSATAATDVEPPLLVPVESAPPALPTEETSGVSSTTAFAAASGPGVNATPDPEPLTPAEGVALRWPPSAEIYGGESELLSASRGFQYGLGLGLRGVYDDNINLTRFNKVSDYYFAIEPAIALGFGDVIARQENYIRLDYAPSILLFSDHSENDAVQHLIRLEGQYRFSRLTLQLTQDVQLLDGTNINSTTGPGNISNTVNLDVAGRTQVDIYRTHLGASYDLTDKTFLSGALEYSVYDYHSLSSSERILGNLFINYKYSPKLVIGIGGSGGYLWADAPNPNQTFEQANVRTTYQATGKISLYAEGGVEFRQFENNNRDTYVTPVYELGATYQPFDGTTITLRGNRRIQNSAVLAGQDFVLSNIIVAVRQRLFQRIYIGVTGGYEHGNYFSTVSGVDATRDDNYYIIEPTVDIELTRRWTIGAYYLHRQNDSSSDNFTFDDNQVGVRTKFVF